MRRFVLFICLNVLLGSSINAQERGIRRTILQATTQSGEQLDLYKESHALLIGVSEYTKWPRLGSIPKELDLVEKALKAQDFNVVRLNNPKGRELSNGIEDFIDRVGYERENRILIYFSGHGHSIGDKGFLIPADTPLPGDKTFRAKTVSMSRVLSWARDMEAKHVLFLFDSCFSGSVFKSRNLPGDSERYIRKATAAPVRQFITAGGADQVVPAQSTFTPALVRAINGDGDLNKDGYITGSELGVHLSQVVPEYVEQNPQYGKIRDYNLAQGDFVFFNQSTQPPPLSSSVENRLEVLLWQSAERGDTKEEYQAFIDQYPSGTFAGIAQTRIDRLARSQVTAAAPVKKELEKPSASILATLTIQVKPEDARVRIMNIVPRYRDRIELEKDKRYDILVTREGYEQDRRMIQLSQQNQIENITLERIVKHNEPSLSTAPNIESKSTALSLDRNVNSEAITLSQACEGGIADECYKLALLYRTGRGVERDYKRMIALFRQACEAGYASGCRELGMVYREGIGLDKDEKRALAFFKLACDRGDGSGCANLGLMYRKGVGVDKDEKRGRSLYERALMLHQSACTRGNAYGCRSQRNLETYIDAVIK